MGGRNQHIRKSDNESELCIWHNNNRRNRRRPAAKEIVMKVR